MGPAFRPQGHARGGRDQHEAGVLVAGVVQRIEAAGYEGVVDGADREQPLAEQVAGETEGGEHEEEVVLGDAELDMLPRLRSAPFLGRGDFRGGEDIRQFLSAEQAALVHTSTEERSGGTEGVSEGKY